jgi:hypothetical protein
MEHVCDKCGNAVEDGVALCSHCRAPQIRVAIAEQEPQPSAAWERPFPTVAPTAGPATGQTDPSQTIYWGQGLPAAALAGVVAGIGMMFVGVLGGLAGGFLSVVFYRRRTRGGRLLPRAGARLGALSGLLGFSMFAFVTVPTGLFRTMMVEMIRKYSAQSPDPQMQALAEGWLDALKTPGGVTAWLVGLLLFLLVAAAVGGALGGALLSRRGRRH